MKSVIAQKESGLRLTMLMPQSHQTKHVVLANWHKPTLTCSSDSCIPPQTSRNRTIFYWNAQLWFIQNASVCIERTRTNIFLWQWSTKFWVC